VNICQTCSTQSSLNFSVATSTPPTHAKLIKVHGIRVPPRVIVVLDKHAIASSPQASTKSIRRGAIAAAHAVLHQNVAGF